MTITESKRRFDDHGNVSYSKHKIFLYREDFDKFEDGFLDAVDKIKELMETGEFRDPIAERRAGARSSSRKRREDIPSRNRKTSEDDIAFDDL